MALILRQLRNYSCLVLIAIPLCLTACDARGIATSTMRLIRGEPSLDQAADNCVVSIAVPTGRSGNTMHFASGAGVQISGNRVITANHVVFDARPTNSQIAQTRIRPWRRISFEERGEASGAVLRSSSELDLAVFHLDSRVPGVAIAKLARSSPQVGDRVMAFGLGGEKNRTITCQVVSRAKNGPFIALDFDSIRGDSGGPVFDQDGRLVGIILGGGPRIHPWSITVQPGSKQPFHYKHRYYPGTERRLGTTTLVLDLTDAL